MRVAFELNGRPVAFDVACDAFLLDVLRGAGLASVRRGCDSTSCGVCTVLLDDRPVPSCSVLAVRVEGRRITTVEGIPEEVARLARHFGEEGADQCGYCNPGLALAVYALRRTKPDADDAEIRRHLVGNLCRCSGYQSQLAAIRRYLEERP